MRSFLKSVFASIIGTIVGGILVLLLAVVLLSGAIAALVSYGTTSSSVSIVDASVLVLRFRQPIVDRVESTPLSILSNLGGEGEIGLNDILKGVEQASTDARIKGIYIDATQLSAGMATIEEIRNALSAFRETGKFVIAYADSYDQRAYYLASVADKIYLHPEGGLELKGLAATSLFFQGTLDMLGIEPQIIRHGKFKSAIEPFVSDRMSDENREQILRYTGSIWQHWLGQISTSRMIPVTQLANIASNLQVDGAQTAKALSLIDDVRYKDQVIDELALLTMGTQSQEPNTVALADYLASDTDPSVGTSHNQVAVLYAQGDIMDGGKQGIVGNELAKHIRALRLDTTVRAVVLRVNSPGGSALASDIIWRELSLLTERVPVVVSMGDVAASGGYYIACPATKILASPTTITGSIGVFGLAFNVQKGAKTKLGITADVAKTNPYADLGNAFRPMTTLEHNYMLKGIERVYTTFTGHVAQGRHMSVSDVDAIAQGRVWSGVDALQNGLIDQYGGLTEAINMAVDLASLTHHTVIELPEHKQGFEAVMEMLGQSAVRVFKQPTLTDLEPVATLLNLHHTIQTRLPIDIVIE